MEKYATYRLFKNETTGEIKKVLVSTEDGLEKVASYEDNSEWVELDKDPEEQVLHNFDDGGKTFVNYYNLSLEEEKAQYEAIINDPEIIITREEFMYDKSGKPRTTIW